MYTPSDAPSTSLASSRRHVPTRRRGAIESGGAGTGGSYHMRLPRPGNWRRVLCVWRCAGGFGVPGEPPALPKTRVAFLRSRGIRGGAKAGSATPSGAAKKKCMVSRRDARSRRSAAWSRSRGPSEMERASPAARRTSPASRASGQSSRQRARSVPGRPSGVRARRQGPAPARARSSRRRPSMISSDFE